MLSVISFENLSAIFSNNGCIESIVVRLKTYKEPDLPHEVKVIYFEKLHVAYLY